MDSYAIKQHDLEPTFEVQLLDGATPVNLTNAVGAKFIMRNRKGIKISSAMTISSQTLNPGVVSYAWQLGDTDTAGTYQAEIQVVWPGGRPQTFPGSDYLSIQVVKDLDQAGAV